MKTNLEISNQYIPFETTRSSIAFTEVYKTPFTLMFGTKVVTSDTTMAFDFIPDFMPDIDKFTLKEDDKEAIIRVLNGSPEKLQVKLEYSYQNGIIFVDKQHFLWIRGRGHLIAKSGGLGLSKLEAIRIQNDFAKFIIYKLRNAS